METQIFVIHCMHVFSAAIYEYSSSIATCIQVFAIVLAALVCGITKSPQLLSENGIKETRKKTEHTA